MNNSPVPNRYPLIDDDDELVGYVYFDDGRAATVASKAVKVALEPNVLRFQNSDGTVTDQLVSFSLQYGDSTR